MPNLILYNGKLTTQDPNYPHATALALRDGQILALGSDPDIRALARTHTQQIDLNDRRLLPGLTDAHFHLYDWAMLRRGIALAGTVSLAEVRERVQLAIQRATPGQWILGQGWNQDAWPNPQLPDRTDLDDLTPDNPVILWRADLHLAPLGLVASVQPLHVSDDMATIDRACGERAQWAYAFRNLLDAGTTLALGSDCPVASPNPFWGIHTAVTRQHRDGTPVGGWHPTQ
ncbi:MAG: amidohydrolase family protein [Chloroflexi bacterium]|nr:amidohydrolase family protein [Chloroflexota bacterium]